jgi:hypothetical protein
MLIRSYVVINWDSMNLRSSIITMHEGTKLALFEPSLRCQLRDKATYAEVVLYYYSQKFRIRVTYVISVDEVGL